MKSINKKGFTLVELLSVIVILGILATMAIMGVTKQVEKSRRKAMVEDAQTVVEAVREDIVSARVKPTIASDEVSIYDFEAINKLLDNKLAESPYGSQYKYVSVALQKPILIEDGKKVKDTSTAKSYVLYVCLIDESGNGFDYKNSNTINDTDVTNGITTSCSVSSIPEYTKGPANEGTTSSSTSTEFIGLGDYFTMTPTATSFTLQSVVTGYDSNQTINPSELTLWRVIKENSDGTLDAVSEYTSSTSIYFKGSTGYRNLVGGLNAIALKYINENYTTTARIVGYDDDNQNKGLSPDTAFNGTSTEAPSTTYTGSPTSGTGQNYTKYAKGDLGDTLYLKDYQLINNVYTKDNNTSNYGTTGLGAYKIGTNTITAYWLSSRKYMYSGAANFSFKGRYINGSGNISDYTLRSYYANSWKDDSYSASIRPIITLKSSVKINTGSGTKASPYTLK